MPDASGSTSPNVPASYERFAGRMQVGMALVDHRPSNPFGGEENSGIGRFGGEWAIAAFTTDQWLTVQHTPRRMPF
jgi:aldehyde dehydrogenase (NAD+)